ncbi:MAG: gliding motility-associated C-terminal domain-containing protein [Dehalococcoidales bacterium]|nr:gliding motility-associated C-terminal domain-containing protein [Dehalococcoidales bacterium]
MQYKNSQTKQKKINISNLLGMAFVTLFMFLSVSTGIAATLTSTPPDFTLTDLRLGYSYRVEDLISTKVKFTYSSVSSGDTLVVGSTIDGFNLPAGYEFLPSDFSVTVDPSSTTITTSGSQEVSVTINVPLNTSYLGKKYFFGLEGRTSLGSGLASAVTTIKVNMGSQYIGYGVTGYDALGTIGMVGNKAYVTANVASLTAPTLKLYYRKTGDTAWTTVTTATTAAKTNGSTDYTFEFPASVVTTAGFQYIIESQAGTDYAYSPEQTRTEFTGTATQKYHSVSVIRTTTGTITTTGSTLTVNDGNPNDGAVKVIAPSRAVGSNLDITLEQIDETSTSCPAAPSYSLSEKPAMIFKLTPNGTRFLKNIDLSLLYFDTDNNGLVDGLLDLDGNATIEEAKLKMFWWDGFKWRLVNGTQTQDITTNTITVKTNHFSYYALFPVNSLSPEDYRPAKKIITPNGDGVNDEADFSGLAEEVKIFDITGRKIRSVSAGTGQWDGKDDDGSVVESGVYIYQFKVDGTLVSGVIAVAK